MPLSEATTLLMWLLEASLKELSLKDVDHDLNVEDRPTEIMDIGKRSVIDMLRR